MILPGLPLELVYQFVSFGGIAVLHGEIALKSGEIAGALGLSGGIAVLIALVFGRRFVKLQAVPCLVLAVIELLGGPVDQLLPL